jgi:hypothetical protein
MADFDSSHKHATHLYGGILLHCCKMPPALRNDHIADRPRGE